MNALVQFKSKVYGIGSPTPAQKAEVNKEIQALYQAKRRGIFKEFVRQVYGEKAVKSLEKSLGGNAKSTGVSKSTEATSQQVSGSASTGVRPSNEISADTFLQLLVMQMQYQDPLEPIQNTDMLAQLAQFSNLEQSVKMNSKMDYLISGMQSLVSNLQMFYISSAPQLVGKYVEGATINGEAVKGKVESVVVEDGSAMVVVGGAKVPLTSLQMVSDGDGNFASTRK